MIYYKETSTLYLIPPDGEPDPCESVVEVNAASAPFVRTENESHVIFRNLFIKCHAMVSFSPWCEERWMKSLESWALGDRDEERAAARVAAYPELLQLETHYDRNVILGNVGLGCRSLALDDAG